MADWAMKQVNGVPLRADPARDDRFHVVDLPQDLAEYPAGSPDWQRESLHRHMHTEMESLEIAAQSLADFPDAPWPIRLEQARQCWDEARHTQVVERQLRLLGGAPGDYPVSNYDWGTACAVDTLIGRVTLQNRTVEAGEMDLLRALRDSWTELGDDATAATMDGILADEVQHVRYANQWLKAEARRDPRTVMQVGRAIDYLRRVTAAFEPDAGTRNAAGVEIATFGRDFTPNAEDRRLAEFSDADIAALTATAS